MIPKATDYEELCQKKYCEKKEDLELKQEDEEPAELTILGEAIEAAKKAYEDLLMDKYNIDPARYRLSVEIEFRDCVFATNLGKLTYKDLS